MHPRAFTARRLLLVLLSVLIPGCGSGSDSTVTVPVSSSVEAALFSGTYHMLAVVGSEDGGSEDFLCFWGRQQADGLGTFDGPKTLNFLGNVVPFPAGDVTDYAVEADRTFTIETPLPGIDQAAGAISADGDLVIGSGTTPGTNPSLWVFGRPEATTFDLGSVAGMWRYVSFASTAAGANTSAGWGSVTFDGAGGGNGTNAVNQEGATFGPAMIPVAYNVTPDGGMTMSFAGGATLDGGIVAGGSVLLLSGGSIAGESPQTHVFVRAGAGMGDADLTGNYHLAGLTQQVGSNNYTAVGGQLLTDGMGAAFLVGMANEEGAVAALPIMPVTTLVGPTGELTVTTGGGDILTGALSADGRFGVFGGPTNAGSDPSFFVLLR